MHITNSFINKLKISSISNTTNERRYYDDNIKGFGVRITRGGIKAYFVEKRIDRKSHRITLGRYPHLSVDDARHKANEFLGKIANGINPIIEKEESTIRNITLQIAFNDYINARKNLKSSTISVYTRAMKLYFCDWKDKPLVSITKELVAKRHAKIGESSKSCANLSMQLLRAIFTFASGQYDDSNGHSFLAENPTKIISHARSWFEIKQRTSIINQHELARWYSAVQKLDGNNKASVVRNYLLLILFTGLRKEEAAQLKWSDINFNSRTLTVTETKNKLQHVLPLSDYIFELLQKRRNSASTTSNNDYVFAGNGADGHLVEPRKQIAKVVKMSGISFTLHDLRRTFITIAESLDISIYTLKKLLNHKPSGDVTASYIIMDVERLRKPIQMIANRLLELINKPPAEVNFINTVTVDFADVLQA